MDIFDGGKDVEVPPVLAVGHLVNIKKIRIYASNPSNVKLRILSHV